MKQFSVFFYKLCMHKTIIQEDTFHSLHNKTRFRNFGRSGVAIQKSIKNYILCSNDEIQIIITHIY